MYTTDFWQLGSASLFWIDLISISWVLLKHFLWNLWMEHVVLPNCVWHHIIKWYYRVRHVCEYPIIHNVSVVFVLIFLSIWRWLKIIMHSNWFNYVKVVFCFFHLRGAFFDDFCLYPFILSLNIVVSHCRRPLKYN